MAEKANVNKGPLIIHCSAGIGRTGVFCAVHSMLKKLEHDMKSRPDVEPIINMVDAVLYLRQQRSGMIQTKEQYEFCYLAFNAKLQQILGSIKRIQPATNNSTSSPSAQTPSETTPEVSLSPPVHRKTRPTTRKIDPKRASVIYEKVDISQETNSD